MIFTAGIGEHMPSIRWRICEGMEFLGIRLDSPRNDHHAAIILRDDTKSAWLAWASWAATLC